MQKWEASLGEIIPEKISTQKHLMDQDCHLLILHTAAEIANSSKAVGSGTEE